MKVTAQFHFQGSYTEAFFRLKNGTLGYSPDNADTAEFKFNKPIEGSFTLTIDALAGGQLVVDVPLKLPSCLPREEVTNYLRMVFNQNLGTIQFSDLLSVIDSLSPADLLDTPYLSVNY